MMRILRTAAMILSLVGAVLAGVSSPAHAEYRSKHKPHVRAVTSSTHHLPWRIAPAHSILLKELRSGRILYEHDSLRRLSPASLTKIMSALVILERGKLGQAIRDKRVLRLIGRYLRAGVMNEGVVQPSDEGTPQGGPLSPLLANIYLDALDQELTRRGLAFCRYADDCNIYVRSPRAAERVLASLTAWIQKHLRLEVNATKSGVGRPWERQFLGFTINPQGQIEVAPQSVERFQQNVRELWRSCQSLSSAKLRDHWRAYVQGCWAYYGLAEDRRNSIRQHDEAWHCKQDCSRKHYTGR